MDKVDIKSRLESAYLRRDIAAVVKDLQLLTGGSASETWSFSSLQNGKSTKQILRLAHSGNVFALGLDKNLEGQVQNLAAFHGVKAAPVALILESDDDLGDGFVMPFYEGESIPQRILRRDEFEVAREQLCDDCAKELATIHSIPAIEVDFLPNRTIPHQLDLMRGFYKDTSETIPLFDYAFRWLSRNQPMEIAKALVHGDFRNGNLLVNETGLACVMDWELSHVGDPMEDLGWLCVPSWRFGNIDKPVGGFGDRSVLFDFYEKYAGVKIDSKRVQYWELFGILKWGVICLYQTYVHLRGEDRSINRAAIGRRVSETEIDMLALLEGHFNNASK